MFRVMPPFLNLKIVSPTAGTLLWALLLALTLAGCSGEANTPAPRAIRGVLDLSNVNLKKHPVPLNGQWRFYPGRLLGPADPVDFPRDSASAADNPPYINVPANWSKHKVGGKPMGADGFGTYALKLILPESAAGRRLALRISEISSAHRLFLNGKELSAAGKISETKAHAKPGKYIRNRTFTASGKEVLLLVQVSNYDLRFGGLYNSLLLGGEDAVAAVRERTLFYDFFLFGALVIMGLYHLGLFVNRREDWASLLFGVVCLDVALRALTTGDVGLQLLAPLLSFDWVLRIEYLTFYIGTSLVQAFFAHVFARRTRVYSMVIFAIPTALFSLQVLFTPTRVFTDYLLYFQLVTLGVMAYCVTIVIMAIIKKQEGARMAFAGGMIFALTIIHDMFVSQGVVHTPFIAPLGLFFFIFLQAALLSRIFSSAFTAVRTLTDRLRKTNQSYSRFVPREFLDQLHKQDITDISLGDQIQKDMTVFFADIRSFTELSESMTPQQNFDFLNSYLKRMTPIVRDMGGFIDKYIGDSIMALFPESPEAAVRTAVRMQETLRDYNDARETDGLRAVRVGIGIHTGNLMLGTIGAEDRMEGTVISDSVNTASRIEQLTKTFGVSIVVSEDTMKLIPENTFRSRLLGHVRVKGKQTVTTVHQILDGSTPRDLELYEQTRELFAVAVRAFHDEDYEFARSKFQEVERMHPEDAAARLYVERIPAKAG